MNELLTMIARTTPGTRDMGGILVHLPLVGAVALILAYGPGEFDPEVGFVYPVWVVLGMFALFAVWAMLLWRRGAQR